MSDERFRCSFCDKAQHEVEVLLAGPCNDLYICDECVSLCHGIVEWQRRKVEDEETLDFLGASLDDLSDR